MLNVKYTCLSSPLGMLGVAATERGLCRLDLRVDPLSFGGELENRYTGPITEDDHHFDVLRDILTGYFEGRVTDFGVDVHFIEGTEFQRQVWRALQTIPFGQVRSYARVAKEIGRPRAVRAVGQANGRNPVAIIVPCHRVIRNDGTIGGYGSGIDVKRMLLSIEGVFPEELEKHRVTVQPRFRL